jgi:hypothetical protein
MTEVSDLVLEDVTLGCIHLYDPVTVGIICMSRLNLYKKTRIQTIGDLEKVTIVALRRPLLPISACVWFFLRKKIEEKKWAPGQLTSVMVR